MKKKMSYLISLGILFLFAGMILIIAGTFAGAKHGTTDTKTKVAIGGFIGPIPFGFANDKRVMYVVVGMMVALIVFYVIMARRYF